MKERQRLSVVVEMIAKCEVSFLNSVMNQTRTGLVKQRISYLSLLTEVEKRFNNYEYNFFKKRKIF